MLKKCLYGFFDNSHRRSSLEDMFSPLSSVCIIDESPPLSEFLQGEIAPIPRKPHRTSESVPRIPVRRPPYLVNHSKPTISLQPVCENRQIYEHVYEHPHSENYCKLCGNECSHQCIDCTMSLCWGCYGRQVHCYK